MKLSELKPKKGSKRKAKKVGRGLGSGRGAFSTRGVKGQRARSGSTKKPGFEGGRTPLISQIPKKRGFKSIFKKPEIVNLTDLAKIFKDGDNVGKKELFEAGLLDNTKLKIKILGNGEIDKKLVVEADYFSKSAEDKIKKAGGDTKIIKKKTRENKKVKKDKKK